jgi:HEAT repeat protein
VCALCLSSDDPRDLRQRFGVERAARLVHSIEPADRLRGVERAAAAATPEALALLVQQAEPAMLARNDARFRIALARGLALQAEQPSARAALLALLQAPTPRATPQHTENDEPSFAARVEMARRIAALALAEGGDTRALDALVALAANDTNGAGTRPTPGASAALAALAAFPPRGSVTWAKPMTAGMARLVGLTGDLRAAGAVLEAAKSGEPAVRAAAIEALGALGDGRVVATAAAALVAEDARVRVAAGSALVALGAPAAPKAVEALLADDATAGDAIVLAERTHGPGVVKALAARAKAAADVAARSWAVAALGRDPTGDAVEALSALATDAVLGADAADALARSPAKAAMPAIERLAASPASRRRAARAYVVRRLARGETSGAMEETLADLVASSDARDRATGVFARVALGEASAASWLEDKDARVRRAAAIAALGRLDEGTRALLLSRRNREEDAATRAVLAAALVAGDASSTTTRDLRACAHAGGADAALCTLALAARTTSDSTTDIDALLSSPDPLIRAHAARGLGASADPARAGRLLAAYSYEPDPLVRRAALEALSTLPLLPLAITDAVALAARIDPDAEIRWTAARVAAGAPVARSRETDIAWIHLVDASGAPPPEGATGALLRADGLAVPIVFDADGDALVAGLPAGSAQLLLAPRVDAAYAAPP